MLVQRPAPEFLSCSGQWRGHMQMRLLDNSRKQLHNRSFGGAGIRSALGKARVIKEGSRRTAKHLYEARSRTVPLKIAQRISHALPGPRSTPDYLIVGEKRCGTTSLHRYLLQHPQVRTPLASKSTHFFDLHFDRGVDWYTSFFPVLPGKRTARSIVGETSPYYLFHPLAGERISDVLPDVRLIVLLREPGLRAWSHYQYEHAKGTEPLSFADAIAAEPERLNGVEQQLIDNPNLISDEHRAWSYVSRSRYGRSLARLTETNDRARIHVVRSESLFEDPHSTLAGVHEFLGLDRFETPDLKPGRQNIPTSAPTEEMDAVRELIAEDNATLDADYGVSW